MSKAVLMSMNPRQCELVASGEATSVVRKTKTKLETPFKVYIYCTKGKEYFSIGGGIYAKRDTLYRLPTGEIKFGDGFELMGAWSGQYDESNFLNGKVIGEFVCDKIDGFNYGVHEPYDATNWQDCYKGYPEELYDMEGTYLTVKEINDYGNGRFLYALNISNLVIYDKPMLLSDFYVWKKCNSCKKSGYEASACIYDDDCKVPAIITSPPKSFCYVEELS